MLFLFFLSVARDTEERENVVGRTETYLQNKVLQASMQVSLGTIGRSGWLICFKRCKHFIAGLLISRGPSDS